jgi:hypothetical protein
MPIGFPAYTEKTVKYRGSSRKELARAAEDALDELGWHPVRDGKWCVRASVPVGFYIIFLTWGARFTVEIEEEKLFIRSEGSFPLEWLDVGQHSENIKRFLDRFEDILDDQG